jgi:hypothetical protein
MPFFWGGRPEGGVAGCMMERLEGNGWGCDAKIPDRGVRAGIFLRGGGLLPAAEEGEGAEGSEEGGGGLGDQGVA